MKKLLRIAFCIGALLIAAGCSSSPMARLYVIEPMVIESKVGVSPVENETDLAIVVGPITLPEFLNRKEIVAHDQRYRVTTAEFDRWAEPLDENISAALAGNLSALVPSDRVAAYPWDDVESVDYSVRVRVHRFGSESSGDIVLSASWSIVDANDVLVAHKKGRYTQSQNGTNIVAVVEAMSQTLELMSRDIAGGFAAADVAAQHSKLAGRP